MFSEKNQQIALEGAQQSITLLRNPPAVVSGAAHLPLKKGLKLAVVGPNGNVADVFQVAAALSVIVSRSFSAYNRQSSLLGSRYVSLQLC